MLHREEHSSSLVQAYSPGHNFMRHSPRMHFSLGRQVLSGSKLAIDAFHKQCRDVTTAYHNGCSVILPNGANKGFLRAVLNANLQGEPYWSQPDRAY
ncbi:unnamed protein product [Brugia timori]|uniref:Uncharacterized protein n=1 Tax=Brugia timori TaxID=42155 RepID=A0A3P7VJF4_9BILA|nr:unnamed protein product [Brugia timori]